MRSTPGGLSYTPDGQENTTAGGWKGQPPNWLHEPEEYPWFWDGRIFKRRIRLLELPVRVGGNRAHKPEAQQMAFDNTYIVQFPSLSVRLVASVRICLSFNSLRFPFRLVVSDFPGIVCILDGGQSCAVELTPSPSSCLDCAASADPPSQTWPILLGFAASQ